MLSKPAIAPTPVDEIVNVCPSADTSLRAVVMSCPFTFVEVV
jgi:hypothetical protein